MIRSCASTRMKRVRVAVAPVVLPRVVRVAALPRPAAAGLLAVVVAEPVVLAVPVAVLGLAAAGVLVPAVVAVASFRSDLPHRSSARWPR